MERLCHIPPKLPHQRAIATLRSQWRVERLDT
jgi:hypothetical protein